MKKTLWSKVLLVTVILILTITSSSNAYSKAEDYLLPFEGGLYKVTDGPNSGMHKNHSAEAIDFDLPYGTEVYAAKPGTVSVVKIDTDGFGFWIAIHHFDGNISYYAHLSNIMVKVGQRVYYDTIVGRSGNSGNVFPKPYECERAPYCGDHLHFEVRVAKTNEPVNIRYLVDWYKGCPNCKRYFKGEATGPLRTVDEDV